MTQSFEAKTGGLRALVWPAVASLMAFALLLYLGFWQLDRLAWKEGLVASINEGLGKPPVALEEPADAWKGLDGREYLPVSIKGRFRHADERHLFAREGNDAGWHVYTPLDTDGGKLVFVNRGYVPNELKDAAMRREGQVDGEVTVTGLLRKPGIKGWFDQPPDTVRNVFLWRDLGGMAAGLGAAEQARVLPFFIDAAAEPQNPGGWPKGGVTRLTIPNRHLEYALTWFGLAATLLAVFAAFAWTRLRTPAGPRAAS